MSESTVPMSNLSYLGQPKCDPPQDFNATGESMHTTRFHFKTKEFILTCYSTLAILPH